jgi:hypothetical protein
MIPPPTMVTSKLLALVIGLPSEEWISAPEDGAEVHGVFGQYSHIE